MAGGRSDDCFDTFSSSRISSKRTNDIFFALFVPDDASLAARTMTVVANSSALSVDLFDDQVRPKSRSITGLDGLDELKEDDFD